MAGTVGSSSPFIRDYYAKEGDHGRDALFSRFDLDSDEAVEIPQARAFTCHLQTRLDPDHWELQGADRARLDFHLESQAFSASKGVQLMNSCAPYLLGNLPVKGEYCAWMESSAVIYCNSVFGARTNAEGRESTAAAMLTGRIPHWGITWTANGSVPN